MKTLASFLALLFLINCYSYKVVAQNSFPVTEKGKTYEITLKNNDKITAKNLIKDGEQYVYTDKNGQTQTISSDSIVLMREKKFSYGKTIGLVAGSFGVGVIVLFGAVLGQLSKSIN